MNLRSGRVRRILGGSAAAAVLMGGGIGIGVALTGGASAATGSTAAAPSHPRHACVHASTRQAAARCARRLHRPRLLGGIHGQVTFKAKTGFRTFAFERGSVQSVGGSTLTVRAADGTTWTWHLAKGSVIRENGSKVAAGKLSAGEQVLVAGPVVNGANDVKLVRIRP
jgi:hypothetical protein